MNKILRFDQLRLTLIAICFALFAFASSSEAASVPATCNEAEYRQFDFWVGDWDVFDTDAPTGPAQAHATVHYIAGGCAIHELYEQADGLIGDSILGYDAVRKQWQQTWVTNRGSFMVISGSFEKGSLVLEGESHLKDGSTIKQRITWQTKGANVRESAVVSKDLGKTWSPGFDVLFRKRMPSKPEIR